VAADSCQACAEGSYSNAGATICLPILTTTCLPGTFKSGTACTACQSGKYSSDAGVSACTNCPAGTFALLQSQSSCTPCPSGSISDSAGSIVCTACPVGYTTDGNAGWTACVKVVNTTQAVEVSVVITVTDEKQRDDIIQQLRISIAAAYGIDISLVKITVDATPTRRRLLESSSLSLKVVIANPTQELVNTISDEFSKLQSNSDDSILSPSAPAVEKALADNKIEAIEIIVAYAATSDEKVTVNLYECADHKTLVIDSASCPKDAGFSAASTLYPTIFSAVIAMLLFLFQN